MLLYKYILYKKENGRLQECNDEEVWKDVVGFEGFYKVSNWGKVYNVSKEKIHLCHSSHGYPTVHLTKGRGFKSIKRSVHRLVMLAFVPNPENKPQVNHIDGVKHNNHISNLEWATAQENIRHAYATGLNKSTPERSAKLSKALKGRVFSDEHKEQLSLNSARVWQGKVGPNKEKVMSQEQKDKIGNAIKGVNNPVAKSMIVIDSEGNELNFDTMNDAAIHFGLNYTTVTTGIYRGDGTYYSKKLDATFKLIQ